MKKNKILLLTLSTLVVATAIITPTVLLVSETQELPPDEWTAWWELNKNHDTLLDSVDDEVDYVLKGNFNVNKEVLGISPLNGEIENWDQLKDLTGLTNPNDVIIHREDSTDNNWHLKIKLAKLPTKNFDVGLSFYYSAYHADIGNITGQISTEQITIIGGKVNVLPGYNGVENYYYSYKINQEDAKSWPTEAKILSELNVIDESYNGYLNYTGNLPGNYTTKNCANFVATMVALEGLHCAQMLLEKELLNYEVKAEFNYIKRSSTYDEASNESSMRRLDIDLAFELIDNTGSVISNINSLFAGDNPDNWNLKRRFYSGWIKSVGIGTYLNNNYSSQSWDKNIVLNFEDFESERIGDSGNIEEMGGFFFFLTTPNYKWDRFLKDVFPSGTIIS